jgi:hypothetical protein
MCRAKSRRQSELIGSMICSKCDQLLVLTFAPSMKSWSADLEGNASEASGETLVVPRGRGYC